MAPRENEVREHIPVPYDNLFQSILRSRHAVKVIFSLGPIVTQAIRSLGCVHLNKKLIIYQVKRKIKRCFGLLLYVSVGNHFQRRAGKFYVLLRNLKIEFVSLPCVNDE